MLNSVIATFLKFSFLMIFPALLFPTASVDTSDLETASRFPVKNQKVITAELPTNACALASGLLLKEPTEAKHDVALPNLSNLLFTASVPPEHISPNSLDHLLAPVSFLSYLSRFSNSPPTLS